MPFFFEITRVTRLLRPGLTVLVGRLLSGVITAGTKAVLVHHGEPFNVTIRAVAIDGRHEMTLTLRITIDSAELAARIACPGDVVCPS